MSVQITPSLADELPNPPNNCNDLSVVVEKVGRSHSQECFSWGPERYKRQIHIAAATGDWVEASSYDKIDSQWVRIPLTPSGNTALHVAVSMEQTSFVAKLVECLSMQELEIRTADGNTAFCLAAISGNVEIARILFHKNQSLVTIRGQNMMLPIQLASSTGHPRMVEFLFQKTIEDLQNLQFQDIVTLFFFTITNNIYTVALNLLHRYPKLASTENEEGLTALQVLTQLPYDEEAGYRDILSSLFEGMEKIWFLDSIKPSKMIFDAAKSGNIMILEFLLKYNPDLLMEVNSKGQSLLHIAIIFRQETIYQLILRKGAFMKAMMQLVDFEGNNVLHLAGKLAPKGRFGLTRHHVLMVNDELWFQEVKKIVPPALKNMRNKYGLTPKELFYQEHQELYQQAISELKDTADTFLVVATLIISLALTEALTILTQDFNKLADTPIFKKETWYTIFIFSIAIGTCFCIASMIFYSRAILPSRWRPNHEYVGSRQTELIFGIVTIIASFFIMVIAIASGAILVFNFTPLWVFYVIVGTCSSGVVLTNIVYFKIGIDFLSLVLSVCKEAIVPQARSAHFLPRTRANLR